MDLSSLFQAIVPRVWTFWGKLNEYGNYEKASLSCEFDKANLISYEVMHASKNYIQNFSRQVLMHLEVFEFQSLPSWQEGWF